MVAAVVLLFSNPLVLPAVVDRCEIIERNQRVCELDGAVELNQVIFWGRTGRDDSRRYGVRDWRLAAAVRFDGSAAIWFDERAGRLVIVRALGVVKTFTLNDPEQDDREYTADGERPKIAK